MLLHENFYLKPDLLELKFDKTNKSNEYEFGKLKFSSQVDGDGNDAIFHYAMNTMSTKDKINIILVHGWRSTVNKLDCIFKNSFMQQGFNMYSYVLPYHMERVTKESTYNGEYFITADVVRTLRVFRQAVSDIRALIRHIKEIKKEKVYLVGLSLGGLITNLVCEHEEIDALVSLFYANDVAFTIFEAIPGKYIKRDFVNNKFSKELLSDCWNIINPSMGKPVIDKKKIMLVSGKYDKYILPTDSNKLWEAWDRPLRYVYNCGHSGIVLLKDKIRYDTMDFLRGLNS